MVGSGVLVPWDLGDLVTNQDCWEGQTGSDSSCRGLTLSLQAQQLAVGKLRHGVVPQGDPWPLPIPVGPVSFLSLSQELSGTAGMPAQGGQGMAGSWAAKWLQRRSGQMVETWNT